MQKDSYEPFIHSAECFGVVTMYQDHFHHGSY